MFRCTLKPLKRFDSILKCLITNETFARFFFCKKCFLAYFFLFETFFDSFLLQEIFSWWTLRVSISSSRFVPYINSVDIKDPWFSQQSFVFSGACQFRTDLKTSVKVENQSSFLFVSLFNNSSSRSQRNCLRWALLNHATIHNHPRPAIILPSPPTTSHSFASSTHDQTLFHHHHPWFRSLLKNELFQSYFQPLGIH